MVQENPRIPIPTLGVDLDGTIDEAPIFFTLLCNRWPGAGCTRRRRGSWCRESGRCSEWGRG